MAEEGVDVPLWDDEALLAVVERECPDPDLDRVDRGMALIGARRRQARRPRLRVGLIGVREERQDEKAG